MKTSWFLLIACIAGCFDPGSGPYADLEAAFPSKKGSHGKEISAKKIVLTSNRHKGAYTYGDTPEIRLSKESVYIDPHFPTMERIEIPINAVSGCGKSCFGSSKWDADILIGQIGVELSIPNSEDVIEWCWENRIPIIPGNSVSDWQYKQVPLPDKSSFTTQFSSREEYDRLVKRSCQGY
jgi:hypothetical protein